MLMKDRCFDKKMLLSGFMHGGLFSVKNNCLGIKFMKNDEIWIGLSWRNILMKIVSFLGMFFVK